MRRRVALMYGYFRLKNLSIPYFRTVMVFSGVLTFHFFLIYAIFPIPIYFTPFGVSKVPIINYAIALLWFGILYLIFSLLFRKRDLESYSFTENELKKGSLKLFLYFVFLFLLTFIFSMINVRMLW